MLITFEGIDGSGKSTQIELLRDKLEEEGHEVGIFREPGGTGVSEKVRSILLNSEQQIDPVTELLLFSAARSQLVAEKVIPLLERGTVVILDRYYDSTSAYQGYGRRSASTEQIKRLNEVASHSRVPDITIYLRIGIEEARKRKSQKSRDRMEQSGDTFYKRVIEGFDRLAEEEERIMTIDANRSQDQIHRQIWEEVSRRLNRT